MATDYRMDLEDRDPTDDKRQYSDDEYETRLTSNETPFEMDDIVMENGELKQELGFLQHEFQHRINNIDKLGEFLEKEHIEDKESAPIIKEFAPPENFAPVVGKIYRSSFPRVENFEFLSNLKLKSILVLVPDEYPEENLNFLSKQGITFFQVGMSGNKEPFVNVPHDIITQALKIAINPENHPLLIHCNRGKHRTGCLVGCIRRLQGWSLTMILDEYRRFAAPKARPLDQQFIEMYGEKEITEIGTKNGWLPLKW